MEEIETVVVGASAAGLSTACCLKKAGADYVLLEREHHVAHAWRNHYERLHLHTTKRFSELPHHPWPPHVESYPPRNEVVKYLEDYVARFDLDPRFGQSVESIDRVDGVWRTKTLETTWVSKNVVVATGYTRKPHVPSWPDQEHYQGDLLHSSSYRNGDPWKGKRVLVVGFGNSACEIAIDLHERGAEPTVAVRSGVNIIPRDVLGVPILGIGIGTSWMPPELADLTAWPIIRATIGPVEKLGLKPLPYGPNVQIQKHGRIPLLDIGTVVLIKKGKLVVRPNVERFTETGVTFTDGRSEDFAAVVLGTGYRPAVDDFLQCANDVCDEGSPRESGRESAPGLYFCGFYVSPTGMLREIAIEARRIADSIAGNA